MRLLLRFYPREWRRRYGAEMEALLSQTRLGPHEAVDLLRSALDAHVHPQWPRRGQSPLAPALLGLLVILAAVLSRWLAVTLGAPDAAPIRPRFHPMVQLFVPRQLLVALVLALLAALVAIGGRLVGWRSLTRFGALLAIRFFGDWLLLLLAIGYATTAYGASIWHSNWIAFGLTASVLEVALWGAVAVVVLRRTRLRGRRAFAVGCLLELALGSTGVSLTTPFQGHLAAWLHGYAEPLRIALWAAVLTLVAGSWRFHPGRGGEPPEGAPVPARPMPDPPEPLVAQVNR
jgi:hypothetical protein